MAADARARGPQRSIIAVMVAIVSIGVVALGAVQQEFERFAEEDFPGFNHLIHVDRDLFRAQYALTSGLMIDDVAGRIEVVEEYRSQVARTEDRWASYLDLDHHHMGDLEVALQQDYTSARAEWLVTTEVLAGYLAEGRVGTDPDVAATLAESQRQFIRTRYAVHALEEEVYEPLVERGIDGPNLDPRLFLVLLLGGGLVIGGGAWLLAIRDSVRAQIRERDRIETERTAAANARFRSLVESAHDVITIVSGRDDLVVMSPNPGPLAGAGQSAVPPTVREIPGADAYARWLRADQRVSRRGIAVTIQLEMSRGDASAVHLEAYGTPLIDSDGDRVWVWRDITKRKELELQLQHQAIHDSLTGVANRALLQDRAAHALNRSARTDAAVSVVFCDLDDFKSVNDSLGHDMGDELLRLISSRLKSCIRDTDTLSRFGGDEFVILLEDSDAETARGVAERILQVVAGQVELGHQVFCPTLSIGVATAVPGATPDELIRNADLAMYEAKANGKGHIEVYLGSMHDTAAEMLGLQTDLRQALDRGELSLHYQPMIAIASGELEGVEALLRWHHPERGNVSPNTFIPIAEVTGLIIPIGRWVIQEALATAAELQAKCQAPLLMHINLSPLQLRVPEIVTVVKEEIRR